MRHDMAAPAGAPALPDKARTVPKRKPSKAEQLAAAAQAAAEVRAYDTNPDVIAYRIERMRARVDHLMWAGVILGLAFTAANVQGFAAGAAPVWSIPWCIAWLLDPTVSLVLLGTLLGEQIIARHQIQAGPWIRRTKWVALSLTYLMNTWASYAAGDPAAILLHSVPPIIVFCAAEAITTLKHQITEAVHRAYEAAAVRATAATPTFARTAPARRALVFRTEPRTQAPRTVRLARTFTYQRQAAAEPVRLLRRAFAFERTSRMEPVRTVRHVRTFAFRKAAEAASVKVIRRAFTFHVEPRTEPVPPPYEPADKEGFVREVTGEILAAAGRGDRWGPDYDALMARTQRSRSWCEKAVRAARMAVFSTDQAAA